MFVPDILRAMEEDSYENLPQEIEVRRSIPRSLHTLTREGEKEEEKDLRANTFTPAELGSWRELPASHQRMLRSMASLRQERNGDDTVPLLGSVQINGDEDDDFFWMEEPEGSNESPADISKESFWFGISHWAKEKITALKEKKTSQTEDKKKNKDKGKEKVRDGEEEDEARLQEDELYGEFEDETAYDDADNDEGRYLRPSANSKPGLKIANSNLEINGVIASENDQVAGFSEDIQARLCKLFPKGINVSDLPSSVNSLLISAVELERGDDTQKSTLKFLEYMYDRILQNRLTLKQMLVGGIGGLIIALGVSDGFVTLFFNDVITNNNGVDIKKIISLSEIIFYDLFNDYIAWVVLMDAASRNIKTLVQLVAPSKTEFEYKKGKLQRITIHSADILFYSAGGLVGLLLIYFLSEADEIFPFTDMKRQFIPTIAFSIDALSILMDDLLYFGSRLSHFFRAFVDHYFFQKQKLTNSSPEENWRYTIIKEFEDLERIVMCVPDKSIQNLFKDITRPIFASNIDGKLTPSPLKATEILKTLITLHTYHFTHSHEFPSQVISENKKRFARVFEWGLPLMATWGRSMAFYYVVYQLLTSIGVEDENIKIGISISLGGIIASLIQLKFEIQGIHHILYKFIGEKRINGISSLSLKQKILSTIFDLHDYFAGLWITAPYILIGIYATEGWNLGKRLVCLIPTALTGFLGNSMLFQESHKDSVAFVKSLSLTVSSGDNSFQREKLIKIVRQYKNFFKTINPSLLGILKEILDQFDTQVQDSLEKMMQIDSLAPSSLSSPPLGDFFSNIATLELFSEKENSKTSRFLIYAYQTLTQNKITLGQMIIGTIGGVVIGILNGGSVYSPYVYETIFQSSFNNSVTDFIITNIPSYNIYSTFFVLEGLSRGVMVISKLLATSTFDFQEKQEGLKKKADLLMKVLNYGAASIISLLPVYYYLEGILSIEERVGSSIFIDFGYTAPFIFLNSFFFFAPRLIKQSEKLINKLFLHIDREIPSEAELKRRQFLKEFKGLKWWFAHLDDENIHEIYHQIFSHPFYDSAEIQEEREKTQVTEALKTLWILRHTYSQYQNKIIEPEPDINRKALSKIMGWGLPLLATFGRSFIYWYIFYNLFDIIGVNEEIAKMTLSIICGGIIGSLAQGSIEVEATEKIVYDLTNGKKIGKDNSHSWVRKAVRRLGKAHNFFAAGLLTLIFMGVGITATSTWDLSWRLVTLIPTGLADLLKNVFIFNQSIGGAAQFVDQVAAKVSYPTASQKRNQLVALTRRYRKMFKKLHPDILLKLDEILERVSAEQQDLNPAEEEIFDEGSEIDERMSEEGENDHPNAGSSGDSLVKELSGNLTAEGSAEKED